MKPLISSLLFFLLLNANTSLASTERFFIPGICSDSTNTEEETFLLEKYITKQSVKYLENSSTKNTHTIWSPLCVLFDSVEAGLQKTELVNNNSQIFKKYLSQSEIELRKMIKTIRLALNNYDRVVLYAHSQGTIFADEIARRINNPDKLKVIQIAPANSNQTIGSIGYVKFKDDLLLSLGIGLKANILSSYVDGKKNSHKLITYVTDPRAQKKLILFDKIASDKEFEYENSIGEKISNSSLIGRDLERLLWEAKVNKREILLPPKINKVLEAEYNISINSEMGRRIKKLKEQGLIWSDVTLAGKWILYKPLKNTKNCNIIYPGDDFFYGFDLKNNNATNVGLSKHRFNFWSYVCKYGDAAKKNNFPAQVNPLKKLINNINDCRVCKTQKNELVLLKKSGWWKFVTKKSLLKKILSSNVKICDCSKVTFLTKQQKIVLQNQTGRDCRRSMKSPTFIKTSGNINMKVISFEEYEQIEVCY